MLNLMWDGLNILYLYKAGIIVFLVTIFGLGNFIFERIQMREIDREIKFLASFSIGAIVLSVLSYIAAWLGLFFPILFRPAAFLLLLFSILVIVRGIWLGEFKGIFSFRLTGILVGLLLLLVVRMAFLEHSLLPSYSDSPIHYQLVADLLNPGSGHAINLSLGNIFQQYYHLGFHSQAAWLVALTGMAPGDVLSLLGQIYLVLVPISILFLTWQLTGSMHGAIFAGFLSAVAWYMPAFAVNWGKFPALSSLALLPAALAFMRYYLPGNMHRKNIIFICLLLAGGIMLLHTRIILCILLAVGAMFLSNKMLEADELGFPQALRLSLLYILSMFPIYQLIVDFYSGIPSAIGWLILLPFSFQAFPRVSLAVILFMLGSWFTALVPPLLVQNGPELIDRQFLEIMMYIPFSILGGAGFAGMLKKLSARISMQRAAAIALVVFSSLVFLKGETLLPDPCCNYFEADDQAAFQWIEGNVPHDSLILISTAELKGQTTGTDAGIWIQPLLGLSTNKIPYDMNWRSQKAREDGCLSEADSIFIYAGGRQYSFQDSSLQSVSWIQRVFVSGKVTIFRITGCGY